MSSDARAAREAADDAATNAQALARRGDPVEANTAARAADLAHQAAILAVECPDRAHVMAGIAEEGAALCRGGEGKAIRARKRAGRCKVSFYVHLHETICVTAGGEFYLCSACQRYARELTQ